MSTVSCPLVSGKKLPCLSSEKEDRIVCGVSGALASIFCPPGARSFPCDSEAFYNTPPCMYPFQLAVSSGEHQVATAPLSHAEGGCTGLQCCGPGGASCVGALLRWLGQNPTDCGSGEDPSGPLLQDHGGRGPLFVHLFLYRIKDHFPNNPARGLGGITLQNCPKQTDKSECEFLRFPCAG